MINQQSSSSVDEYDSKNIIVNSNWCSYIDNW